MSTMSLKPKVSLVRPPVIFKRRALTNEATPALGLAYISGYLRKHGYDPVLVDSMGEALNQVWQPVNQPDFLCQGLTFPEVIERLPSDTEVIGVTAMFSGEWLIVREFITYIREHFPNALIIAGGEHITGLPEYCLRDCPALDICVLGEGEHKCYEVIEAYANDIGFDEVPGIGFLDQDDCYVKTSSELFRIREVNSIPWPDWPDGYLEKFWAAGKSFGPQSPRDIPMMLSRGCPYQCTFCSSPQMWTTRYTLRDIDDVVNEVKHYITKYDITAVQLYDLTAIVKKSWIIDLLTKLIDQDIKVQWDFPSGTRSEILDNDVLTLLKKTGTNYLCYAPESGSPRMLKKIKKRVHLDRMIVSMKTAKKLGMIVRANIIIGFPGETRRDIYKTLMFGLRCTIRGVDEFQPYLYMPYPGSELFARLVNSGQLEVNDEYFFSLCGLNTDLTSFSPITFNEVVGPKELAFYRLVLTILSYSLSYILYPSRIIRTVRNLFLTDRAATVFEHRVKDLLRRKKVFT